jgi:hypothetical protein
VRPTKFGYDSETQKDERITYVTGLGKKQTENLDKNILYSIHLEDPLQMGVFDFTFS